MKETVYSPMANRSLYSPSIHRYYHMKETVNLVRFQTARDITGMLD
jgi:hypothetical protein